MALSSKENVHHLLSLLVMLVVCLVVEKLLSGPLGKDIAHPLAMGLGIGCLIFLQPTKNTPPHSPVLTNFVVFPLVAVGLQTLFHKISGDSLGMGSLTLTGFILLIGLLDKPKRQKCEPVQTPITPANTGTNDQR